MDLEIKLQIEDELESVDGIKIWMVWMKSLLFS